MAGIRRGCGASGRQLGTVVPVTGNRPESAALAPSHPIPKGPVFGWSSFGRQDAPGIPSVEDLRHTTFTTSGRAAIFQALLQLELPASSTVLVPTYHCPTMVAPVLLAGHQPAYFGIRADGLPDIAHIDLGPIPNARAIIVSHYFGLAQSLREIRAWCDANGIALIEDCAHCYFGQAGERAIGAWGDYCTASVSKFFPVPEAGLLGSDLHALKPLHLLRPGPRRQIKGLLDVFETSATYGRLGLLNAPFQAMFRLKRGAKSAAPPSPDVAAAHTMMAECDMGRIGDRPLATSMLLRHMLPRGRIIAQRQRNFAQYAHLLVHLAGAEALFALPPTTPVAPYVFPLWVQDADRVYHALRTQGLPVFRWDRIWPGTSTLPHDVGLHWSHHVLQLLCHQDLDERDVRQVAMRVKNLLPASDRSTTMRHASTNPLKACPS